MEENISRSNIESFKLSITKISQNRIDKYELVNIAKNLYIEISSAATFCIQKRMVLKELLSHVLGEFQDRKYEELLQETISWLVLQSHMATTVLLLDACFKVNVIDDDNDDDDDVETIYNGAKLFKDISIIRLFANIVDSDGKQLFLMPGEETESPAPNLKVFELQDK